MSVVSSQPIDGPLLNVVLEAESAETNEISFKVENSEQHNDFPLAEVSNDTNAICYMNQDNTLSFINNQSVFQTVSDDSGEIYYACIGQTNDVNQQDSVLQLIPQTQLSNYIMGEKDYSNVNFINNPSILSGNEFYSVSNPNYQLPKYQFDNVDGNVFKSINCIGKQICEICSLEFPSKRAYLKHMSIHENDREFKCSWCKLSYNYEVNLLVHIAIIHSNECAITDDASQETTYKCAICSCLFSRKKAHQSHCLVHQVDEDLPCEHCSALFKSKQLLEKHLEDHKAGINHSPDDKLCTNYLKCKLCHQLFNNVGNIKKHYIQYHPKSKTEWVDDIPPPAVPGTDQTLTGNTPPTTPSKLEETTATISASDFIELSQNRRRSSKIASQTIKLYAQGKSRQKLEGVKSPNKRGRPKKNDGPRSSSAKTAYNKIRNRDILSVCVICDKSFKTPILLRRHEVTHTGVKEFQCSICKKGFTQKSSVKIHMAVHDAEKNFCCPFCTKRFTYEHNMNTHIRVIHHDDNDQSLMPMQIGTEEEMEGEEGALGNYHAAAMAAAVAAGNEDVVLTVVADGERETAAVTADDAEINQYLWNETNDQQQLHDSISYQPNNHQEDWDKSQPQLPSENRGILLSEDVERLDRETGQLQLLETIKDQVTGFKRFRCRVCFKLYRKSCDLSRHMRIHNQQRPFQCYMCHKSFRLKSGLRNHYKSHWKLKEYSCTDCNKIFNLKQTLQVHRLLHSPDKWRYACKLCQRRFSTAFHCRYHTSRCTGATAAATVPIVTVSTTEPVERIEQPPVRAFLWNEALNQPVPIESTGRRKSIPIPLQSQPGTFKCNHCGKTFKFKKYLNAHLKDHMSSHDTNTCQFCQKRFLTLRSLQQHLRTQHLNRRKFSCTQCTAVFITKASLIRHGLVHSNNKPYACPMCYQRFKAKIYCDRHIAGSRCRLRKGNRFFYEQQQRRLQQQQMFMQQPQHHHQQAALFDISGAPVQEIDVNGDIVVSNEQLEGYTTFRLEDLDMANNGHSSNILVTNYVNDFSSGLGGGTTDKYMLVSLDGAKGVAGATDQQGEFYGTFATGAGGDIEYQQAGTGENVYYYQAVSEMPAQQEEPVVKGTLADKFPILKASLFSEEDDQPGPQRRSNDEFSLVSAGSNVVLKQQMMLYHGCANCLQQFGDSQSLVNHVKLHHKIRKDYQCNVCHKAFSAKLSLWAHSKTHLDSRSFGCFVCIACTQRFISVPSLSRHVRMQHNDNLNLYRCTHCNKVYKTTRELDSHVKQLVSEYDALIINSGRTDNWRTKTNIDVDMDKVVYLSQHLDQISSIDKSCTASKLSLKQLVKEAASGKRSRSRLPTKKGTIDTSLSYPYSCSICHKGFNRASNLQQHLSVHTKLKPYQCMKCNNRFRHRCSLKTHEATKHGPITKLLRCHLCSKLLRSQVAMRNHMRIHVRKNQATLPIDCGHTVIEVPNINSGILVDVANPTGSHVVDDVDVVEVNDANTTVIDVVDVVEPEEEKKECRVSPEIPKKLIKCLSCSFIFNSQSKYDTHCCIRWNSLKTGEEEGAGAGVNTCCGKTFDSKSQLLKHMQITHQQLIPYNCAQCNIMFAQESSFRNHQKSVHHL